MIKYCFITTVPLTIDCFILKLAQEMKNTGEFDVTLICDYDSDFEKKVPDGITYFPVAMKRGLSITGLSSIVTLYSHFRKAKYDVIQYATPNASFYAALAGKLASVPNRIYSQWGLLYLGFDGLKRRIFKKLESITCRLSTIIQPDSPEHLSLCIKGKLFPKEKGYVIGKGSACGIDLKKYDISKKTNWNLQVRRELKIPNNAFVIGFVGRITKEKGVNEFLSAAKKMVEDYKDVFYVIVGSEDSLIGIDKDLFNWAKNSPQIKFVGFTNMTEKYYAMMNVEILPSYREGFPTAPIEAQAMGVPVVVSNIPGPPDSIIPNETGFLVESHSADALYDMCLYLYKNASVLNVMGEKAHQFITNNFEQKQFFLLIIKDRLRIVRNR